MLSGLRRRLFRLLVRRLFRSLRWCLIGDFFSRRFDRLRRRRRNRLRRDDGLQHERRAFVGRALRLETHGCASLESGFCRCRWSHHGLRQLAQRNRLRRSRLRFRFRKRTVLGDVRRLGLLNQDVAFLLTHLTTAHHVMHQIATAFDRKVTESGGRSDDVAHRAGHLAASLEADLVRALRHLGSSIAGVGGPVTRAATRRRSRWGRIALGRHLFISLRRISHGSNVLLPTDKGARLAGAITSRQPTVRNRLHQPERG